MDLMKIAQEACAQELKQLPDFKAGDTVTVTYKIREENKERFQKFRGIVIQKRGEGATKTFTVRKISNGVGAVSYTHLFFSFGTNDMTQMTYGFSRDDIGAFMGDYMEHGILDFDPFQTLDLSSVGKLVKLGLDGGRSTSPKLKVGICGEHGGDPDSVHFCHKIGMDYVSCSPFRVPIARLAAAQAAIADNK